MTPGKHSTGTQARPACFLSPQQEWRRMENLRPETKDSQKTSKIKSSPKYPHTKQSCSSMAKMQVALMKIYIRHYEKENVTHSDS
ncbi:hypothetical protein E2C01_035299 [Portunus trituberculatus]|uniref:Uncharacterized protein n=1 Tax=Portunus trituberculatus TaxID=210409 RepID=A0A5B7F8Z6_PORTR|nr:hypothetical protein [Portunus trituberculatus]